MPIIRRTHARRRHVNEVLKTYRETPLSIEAVASATGTHFVDAMVHLAQSEENAIRCCDNRVGTFQDAVKCITAASVLVIDLSAIVTLTLLGLVDRLGELPEALTVSSDTVLELRKLREAHRDHQNTKGWVLPTDHGLGICFVESAQEQRQEQYALVEQLLERITRAAKVSDCGIGRYLAGSAGPVD